MIHLQEGALRIGIPSASILIEEHLRTPIGVLRFAMRGSALCALAFEGPWEEEPARLEPAPGRSQVGPDGRADEARESGDRCEFAVVAVRAAIEAYFEGEIHALDGMELLLHGSPFQLAVWEAIRRVPPGETASYSGIAAGLQRPNAVRAVGAAAAANPIWIAVPCHRVIRADGGLGGYGGGLARKRWLLAHEGVGKGCTGSAAGASRFLEA